MVPGAAASPAWPAAPRASGRGIAPEQAAQFPPGPSLHGRPALGRPSSPIGSARNPSRGARRSPATPG